MTVDVAGYTFGIMAIGLSFISARTSYWLLKFMAGLSWWVVGMFWIANSPSDIAKGSPTDIAILFLLFFAGLAFMLMAFWTTRQDKGQEVGKGFKIPFISPSDEEEEEERRRSYRPSRQERNSVYSQRVRSALQGRGRGRRY